MHGVSVYNKLNPLREELKEAEGNIEVVMHKVTGLTENHVGVALTRTRKRLAEIMKGVTDELE